MPGVGCRGCSRGGGAKGTERKEHDGGGRGESVGGVFARQEKEVMTPTIKTTFNKLFRKGYLGIVVIG